LSNAFCFPGQAILLFGFSLLRNRVWSG
jgi:hypothetical protein